MRSHLTALEKIALKIFLVQAEEAIIDEKLIEVSTELAAKLMSECSRYEFVVDNEEEID